MAYFESTVLVASDLMVAVTVTVEGSKHDTEGSGPLAEEDEEMMSQRLLREEKAPVVDCGGREKENVHLLTFTVSLAGMRTLQKLQLTSISNERPTYQDICHKDVKKRIYQEHTG